jgi:hypothetical protein
MKIGFNCSSFDLFHAGHVTMLKMEKELCDYLKVALQDELYRFENSVNIEHVWFESVRDKNLLEETHRELYHTPPYFFGYYINDYSNNGGKSIQDYPHS